MSKRKNKKLGGVRAYARAKKIARIKAAFRGEVRGDGVKIPSVRRVFKDLGTESGFDLRKINEWTPAQIRKAERRAAVMRTFAANPFQLKTPTNTRQRKQLRTLTGQTLPYQKSYFVHVQDPKIDKVSFQRGKATIVRQFKSGAQDVQRLYLFRDYGPQPVTFKEAKKLLKKMLPDMPAKYRGQDTHYTLYSAIFGQIGVSAEYGGIINMLSNTYIKYDPSPNEERQRGKRNFAESVIGFYMNGSKTAAINEEVSRDKRKQRRAQGFKRKRKWKPNANIFTAPIRRK